MMFRQIVHLKTGTSRTTEWEPGSVQDYIDQTDYLTAKVAGFTMPDGGIFLTAPENIDYIEVEFKEN